MTAPNREDIIRMAREAGIRAEPGNSFADDMYFAVLYRFAALVAAHVRETEFKPDWNNYQQGRADGAAAEREALAQFFQDHWREEWTDLQIAEAIRARGETK